MASNKIETRVSWENLCDMGVRLTNSHGELNPHGGLVYLADNSLGEREVWSWGDPVDRIDNGFGNGAWCGYEEVGGFGFRWTSYTSGALLEAILQKDGTWMLTFQGPDTAENGGESRYLLELAFVADLEEEIRVELGDPQAAAEVVWGEVGRLLSLDDGDRLRSLVAFGLTVGLDE